MSEQTITAVIESGDFEPAFKGQQFVTVTFRVHKDSVLVAGVWELKPLAITVERPAWSFDQ